MLQSCSRWRTAALALMIASSLSACSLFSSDKGPKPTELTEIKSTAEVRILWQNKVSSLDNAILRPAIVGTSVYAAGQDGTLVRMNSGSEAWRIRATKQGLTGGVAADERTVVVGSQNGQLLAFDANDGTARWNTTLNGEVTGVPLIANGLVIVRVGDNQLFAYDLNNGKQRWTYQRAQAQLSLRTYTGFVRSGDLLLAGFSGGKLVALSLSGGFPRWEAAVTQARGSNELERMADVTGEPVLRGRSIYVSTFQGRTAGIDSNTGSVQWARDVASSGGVDADEKNVYLTDSIGTVYALDARTGTTAWKQDQLLYRGVGRPFATGDYIVVGDAQGWVHLLDKGDGHFVGRVRLGDSAITAPFVNYGEGFITQTQNGTVYALAAR